VTRFKFHIKIAKNCLPYAIILLNCLRCIW